MKKKILFVTLGNTNGGEDNKILVELKKLVDIDITDGWISAEDFDKRGSMCDLLISPLRSSMEYGLYKGSGTFGDAVYLRKKVIIPSHVDPLYEFKETALYYDNIESLSQIFIIASISAGCPKRCTGIMAFVLVVIFSSILETSMV